MKKVLLFLLYSISFNAAAISQNTPSITTSIAPISFLVEQIAGDKIKVHTLLSPGQDPHTFSPTPRQIADASKSRLFVSIGLPFEKQLVSKLTNMQKTLKVIKLNEHIHLRQYKKEEQDIHDEEHGGDDIHSWLSPLTLQEHVKTITRELTLFNPAQANFYQLQAKELNQKLNNLHEELKSMLAPFKGEAIYVYHPAFGYFTDTYNLIQRPMEIEGKSPSPKELIALIGKARKEKPKVIFIQPQFSPKQAQVLAKELNAHVATLDDLQKDVLENLRYMGKEISKALKK